MLQAEMKVTIRYGAMLGYLTRVLFKYLSIYVFTLNKRVRRCGQTIACWSLDQRLQMSAPFESLRYVFSLWCLSPLKSVNDGFQANLAKCVRKGGEGIQRRVVMLSTAQC